MTNKELKKLAVAAFGAGATATVFRDRHWAHPDRHCAVADSKHHEYDVRVVAESKELAVRGLAAALDEIRARSAKTEG